MAAPVLLRLRGIKAWAQRVLGAILSFPPRHLCFEIVSGLTLNERENIVPLIERLDAELAELRWEAIFVDDDSTDGTADALRKIARSDPRVRVLQRIGRRGLASAVIEGACATAAPVVAVMDADLQHDPALERRSRRGLSTWTFRKSRCTW